MTTSFTKEEFDQLLEFIGYGNLNADVWFLGMEEAGGGEDNLRRRLKFKEVEDCAEAHDILGIRKHHWGKKTIQRTWRGMCCIMLGLEGKEMSTENVRTYQAEMLGRTNGRTLLTELMPIPKPTVGTWDYKELFPYKSRQDYYDVVKPRRLKELRKCLATHQPKLVVGYGKKYWPDYRSLFSTPFTDEGQFQIAKSPATLVLLTDHFTYKSMNNGYDKIVKLIKRYCPDI